MIKQDLSFWNSEESIKRYSKVGFFLTDVEGGFLALATQLICRSVSKTRILDLGCGAGRTAVPISRMGYDVTGVDASAKLIENFKKHYPDIPTMVGDAADLKLDDQKFDVVLFSHNSLDYLYPQEKRRTGLNEIHRVLKPGGFFIFSSHFFNLIPYNLTVLKNIVCNLSRLSGLLRSGYYTETMDNGMAVETYSASPGQIKAELAKNGFRLIKQSRIINHEASILRTIIKGLLSWEIYYLFQKNN